MRTREWILKYGTSEQKVQLTFLNPHYDLFIIGILGTVGKTTTSLLCHKYLKFLGYNTSVIGTAGYETTDKKIVSFPCTSTSDKTALCNFFLEAYKNKVLYFILETTVETAYKEGYKDLDFQIMGMTNLYKGIVRSFNSDEIYIQEKVKLLNTNKIDIICLNEECRTFMPQNFEFASEPYYFNKNDHLIYTDKKGFLNIVYNGNAFSTNLLSTINADNLVCFLSMMELIGVFDVDKLRKFLLEVEIDGRLQLLELKGRTVIVDTGYNGADGLRNYFDESDYMPTTVVLSTYFFNSWQDSSESIRLKRHQKVCYYYNMGYNLILTSSMATKNNPDTFEIEIPDESIALQHMNECLPENTATVIPNRIEAIQEAWRRSKPSDRILIIGMGTELYAERKNPETNESEYMNDIDIIKLIAEKE